jgi:hypothetical protein
MKLTIESTKQLVTLVDGLDGVQGRIWVGKTGDGIAVQVLVLRVAVESRENQSSFERELTVAHAPVPTVRAFPLRMML